MAATIKHNHAQNSLAEKKLFEEETRLTEEDTILEITERTGLLLEETDTTADASTDMVGLKMLIPGLLPPIKFVCPFLLTILSR